MFIFVKPVSLNHKTIFKFVVKLNKINDDFVSIVTHSFLNEITKTNTDSINFVFSEVRLTMESFLKGLKVIYVVSLE